MTTPARLNPTVILLERIERHREADEAARISKPASANVEEEWRVRKQSRKTRRSLGECELPAREYAAEDVSATVRLLAGPPGASVEGRITQCCSNSIVGAGFGEYNVLGR